MATINLLDVQTANLIAAGEVVERPANVIKELLENAIDAGSTAIVTEIENGGIDLIRVTDNGKGMEKEDLPLCIRRHATSKIRTSLDLEAISTLGFRGEALAAISATSRFTVLSKRKEDAVGHQMTVEGEEILSLEEAGASDGTTIIVRDLFFNQPARKKFLKRAQTESAAILQYLQRLAVSHPEISFRHSVDGVLKLQTMGNGKLHDCIYSVYGREFSNSLVPLREGKGPFSVSGFITRPELSRNNHSYQSFYINSRFVKSRTMQFAMEDAYKSFVKSEKFPGCVLFLNLDPTEVDVNVHPAKLEVRFTDERSVYNTVYSAVRETLENLSNRLARDSYEKAASSAKESVPVTPIRETVKAPEPSPEVKSGSFREQSFELPLFAAAPIKKSTAALTEEEKVEPKIVKVEEVRISEIFKEEKKTKAVEPAHELTAKENPPEEIPLELPKVEIVVQPAFPTETEAIEQLSMEEVLSAPTENNPLLGQGVIRGVLFNAFILYEMGDTAYLIDKHAAHERILYEALKKDHKSGGVQLFLEPQLISLTAEEAASVSEHLKELEDAGFPLEEFGEDSFLLRGIPLEFISLSEKAVVALIEEAARELSLGGKAKNAGEKKFDRTLYSMACKAAVKAGIPSTESDHQWILSKIREIDNITVCPHGRPILVAYTKKEIEGLFLRT